LEWYLAARYFQMNPKQWDQSPWWYTALLMDGLMAEGILKDPNSDEQPQPTGTTAGNAKSRSIDLSGGQIPDGFSTRRVG
jgi:hypothetical protein